MTTLRDKAEAEMAHEAYVYQRAYSHLASQVGQNIMDEMVAAGTFKAAMENVIGQRLSKGIKVGEPLDMAHLGLTEDQLARAAAYREERAARIAAITPATVQGVAEPRETHVADALAGKGAGSFASRFAG